MDTKRRYRHVCKKVKCGGTLTAEALRDFVWTPFSWGGGGGGGGLEMFSMNNKTVVEFATAAVLAQSVERLTAVREVAGLNPGKGRRINIRALKITEK